MASNKVVMATMTSRTLVPHLIPMIPTDKTIAVTTMPMPATPISKMEVIMKAESTMDSTRMSTTTINTTIKELPLPVSTANKVNPVGEATRKRIQRHSVISP